ncbi:MAG: alpha/beta hydrolase-fold protein [Chryseolinea sp.]
MKNQTTFVLLSVIIFSCVKNPEYGNHNSYIKVGRIDSIFSNDLNEERKFWVYLPYGVDNAPEPGKKYPVLYLLDGDAHFQSVTGMIQQMSAVNGNMLCPEMIVVAIPNTDRTRDLTTSHVSEDSYKTSGGAENFTRFLQQLITHVEAKYPVTSYRTLIGHSFGGLFVINTLMRHKAMFANYLAIDPSLWWDDQKLLKESKHLLDTGRFDKKFLYVAMAHTVKKGMSLKDLAKDTTENTRHMRSIIEFCDDAVSKTSNGMTFESKYYPDDGHGTVVLISEHDGLRSMFKWYGLNELADYYVSDSKQSAEQMIGVIKAHYKIVSDHFGYEVAPDRQMVNDLGDYFLGEKRADRALALFTLNVENYPKVVWAFDALGDYYLHEKDTANAIESFDKALAIVQEKGIAEKLDKLKK